MSGELIVGLLGLLGVLLTAMTTVWLGLRQQRANAETAIREQRANEQTERERSDAAAKEEARVAARLLQADLVQATNRLRQARDKHGRYWSPRFALPTATWHERREVVARYMDLEGWAAVSSFFRILGTLELQAEAARERAGNTTRPRFTDFQRGQIDLALRRSETALAALEAFSGDATQKEEDEDEPEVDTRTEAT